MSTVEKRVDRLERVLEEFITSVGIEFNKLYNSQMRTEIELREFKEEMKVFKDEMSVFKNEMSAFKDEMSAFKNEMSAFKDEMRRQTREMNRKWGEMAKKLGTMVEDLVSPSIPRIVKEEFGVEIEFFGIRIKKKLNGRMREYDVIAVADGYVFLNSTKSTLESSDIREFIKTIKEFREYFPEYKGKKIIGIVASLYVDEALVKYAERMGLMVLGIGDELMEVKNRKGFKPKEW